MGLRDGAQNVIVDVEHTVELIVEVVLQGRDVTQALHDQDKAIHVTIEHAPAGVADHVDVGLVDMALQGVLQVGWIEDTVTRVVIPKGCKVLMSARSGNVKDPNDPSFSPWTPEVEVTEATELNCPLGRFCQYRLTLQAPDSRTEATDTPVIREIAVAHVVPNLAPRVLSVNAVRLTDKNKKGVFQVNYKARDDNKDKLVYKIEFRKLGRDNWIELKEKLTSSKFDWDTRTVEDGRYEIRVTASDEPSNSTSPAKDKQAPYADFGKPMTGTRISDPFVVDNTAPVIADSSVTVKGKAATMRISLKDAFTVIGNLSFTVDSNEDWRFTLPDDMVYDTTAENFTILIEDLKDGEHVVALRISDDLDNTMYKTFDVTISN